jgi:hypothetical protein
MGTASAYRCAVYADSAVAYETLARTGGVVVDGVGVAGLAVVAALDTSLSAERWLLREPLHAVATRAADRVAIPVIAMARAWMCAYILSLLQCRARGVVPRRWSRDAVNEAQKGK